ncbi:hypothetical protein Tco_0831475 [Tanacetum coccineum]
MPASMEARITEHAAAPTPPLPNQESSAADLTVGKTAKAYSEAEDWEFEARFKEAYAVELLGSPSQPQYRDSPPTAQLWLWIERCKYSYSMNPTITSDSVDISAWTYCDHWRLATQSPDGPTEAAAAVSHAHV